MNGEIWNRADLLHRYEESKLSKIQILQWKNKDTFEWRTKKEMFGIKKIHLGDFLK
jgi:hypothetical protein